jgi:hypothetical protein
MVSHLEQLLSFHSWYKYGEAPFGPDYENGDADDLLFPKRTAMAGNWMCRNFTSSYMVIALVFFHHAQNFDASSGKAPEGLFQKIVPNMPTAWSGCFYPPSFLLSSNTDDNEKSQKC